MKITLTPGQVEFLFDFVRRKYVRYYDVQSELVDHLATAIEERLEKDTNADFHVALALVYSEFGLFGFSRIVQERETQTQKSSRKMLWQQALKFFSWPVIISTLTLTVGGWLILSTLEPVLSKNMIYFTWVILMGWIYYRAHILYKQRPSKPLLALETSRANIFFPFFYPEVMFVFSTHLHLGWIYFFLVIIMMIRLAAFNSWRNMMNTSRLRYPAAFS
ncbi:MAG: hypothetical protein ABIT96_02400 [Ferruginibacter sp.]